MRTALRYARQEAGGYDAEDRADHGPRQQATSGSNDRTHATAERKATDQLRDDARAAIQNIVDVPLN